MITINVLLWPGTNYKKHLLHERYYLLKWNFVFVFKLCIWTSSCVCVNSGRRQISAVPVNAKKSEYLLLWTLLTDHGLGLESSPLGACGYWEAHVKPHTHTHWAAACVCFPQPKIRAMCWGETGQPQTLLLWVPSHWASGLDPGESKARCRHLTKPCYTHEQP